MITFGWGLEQGFFLELRNCLLACNLTTTILEFFFWLANIPYVDYLPAVVLFFSTWQLPIFLLTRSRLTLRLKQNEELKAAFSTFLILDDEEQARLRALHVLDQDITVRPPTADMQCMEQSRFYISTYR